MNKKKAIASVNPLFVKGICHRGLHNKEYTENGLKAFKNALDHHMAFELDVHLTKDNELVVFHDSDLKRITGKDGIVEDLTLKELKDNYLLGDGDKIPTLKEVFDLVNEVVPIVVELKVYNKNYVALANRVREELKMIKDKRNIILISFDPRALMQFKKDGYIRQLLVTTSHEWVYMFRNKFEGVDLEYVMLKEKRVQRYSKNHFVNIWTVENKEVFDESYPFVDTVTFQHMDEKYVSERLSQKNLK